MEARHRREFTLRKAHGSPTLADDDTERLGQVHLGQSCSGTSLVWLQANSTKEIEARAKVVREIAKAAKHLLDSAQSGDAVHVCQKRATLSDVLRIRIPFENTIYCSF